jgi:hypothetical protein
MVVSFAFLVVLLKFEMQHAVSVDTPRSVIKDDRMLVPAPPLQPYQQHDKMPHDDTADMWVDENKVFQSLGWKVGENNKVVIPDAVADQVMSKLNARKEGGKP